MLNNDSRLLLIDLLLLFVSVTLAVKFWSSVPFVHIGIASIAIIGIILFHSRDDFIFFIAGGVLGGLGELIATHFGIWNYTLPEVWNIPLWIPLMWGLTFMLIRRIRNTSFRLAHGHVSERKPAPAKSLFMVVYDVGTYILVVILVVSLWRDNLALASILTLLCVINMAKFHHTHDVFIVLFIGIIGSIADFYAVHFHLWTYANPNYFGQPFWVYPLYAVFGLITVRIAFVFSKLHRRILAVDHPNH